MKEILYEDLEKHFSEPKILFSMRENKRVPRKFKKKWKHILCGNRYDSLDLGQKLWYIIYLENINYNRFLIKMISKS
jgi:hypothetical protein